MTNAQIAESLWMNASVVQVVIVHIADIPAGQLNNFDSAQSPAVLRGFLYVFEKRLILLI